MIFGKPAAGITYCCADCKERHTTTGVVRFSPLSMAEGRTPEYRSTCTFDSSKDDCIGEESCTFRWSRMCRRKAISGKSMCVFTVPGNKGISKYDKMDTQWEALYCLNMHIDQFREQLKKGSIYTFEIFIVADMPKKYKTPSRFAATPQLKPRQPLQASSASVGCCRTVEFSHLVADSVCLAHLPKDVCRRQQCCGLRCSGRRIGDACNPWTRRPYVQALICWWSAIAEAQLKGKGLQHVPGLKGFIIQSPIRSTKDSNHCWIVII